MALIELRDPLLQSEIKSLLRDRNTGKSIIWATKDYESYGFDYSETSEMSYESVINLPYDIFQPRVTKDKGIQKLRTKDMAEVFTPSSICNYMNSFFDEDYFLTHNLVSGVEFEVNKKELKKYIGLRKLEITCGEAPFIVSRYDSTTGSLIPLYSRVGFLDKKLTIISDFITDKSEWLYLVHLAYESSYGYEYQGDNLFKARLNLFYTFIDYYIEKWKNFPESAELKTVANIISRNLWQMDGLNYTVPTTDIVCKVYNWRSKKNMNVVGDGSMKFDFVVGNPPYQGDNHKQLYPDFFLSAKKMADNVTMIFPVGWQGPKNALNLQKMNTKDVKEDHQIVFIDNRQNVFMGIQGAEWTNIILWKCGYDNGLDGKQLIYTNGENPEVVRLLMDKENLESIPDDLKSIISHFVKDEKENISSIIYSGRSVLKFTDAFLKDYPESPKMRLDAIKKKQSSVTKLGPNEEYELKTSTFDVLDDIFIKEEPKDVDNYYKLYGSYKNKRTVRWILKKYMEPRYKDKNNINNYKVLIAKAASAGDFGAKLSDTIIALPNESCTPTFYGIGYFETLIEAQNCAKYIKTKLFRALLGVLKTTRDNPAPVFAYIPIQDFKENSDIDWSVSISEIDQQLYKKYGLNEKEIAFIEDKVKEME